LIQRAEPHRGDVDDLDGILLLGAVVHGGFDHRDVALQVAFERQNLKPVFHLIGYRLWV
jgi:hypothetical protein